MPSQPLRRQSTEALCKPSSWHGCMLAPIHSSESDDETEGSSQVAKPIKRPRSERYDSHPFEEAPSNNLTFAPNTTMSNSEQSRTVSNDRIAEKPVQTSNAARGKDKEKVGRDDQDPVSLRAPREDKILPARLTQIWTEIDQALPPAYIQNIYQTTFAEFRLATPLAAQPWMQPDNKSGVVALEKARITNGGKIPASWKAAAELSEHGRKWLNINREQERAEVLARARENVAKTALDEDVAQSNFMKSAAQSNEMFHKAQQARRDSTKAYMMAAQAHQAANKAREESRQARIVLTHCRDAKEKASLAASSAAAELKMLEEEAKAAVKVEPQGKKRKLGASKT